MVLKWLTYEKDSKGDGYHEIWNFVDNVKEVSVYWDDKITCTCVKVSFRDGDSQVFAIHNEGYILSDSGKTIERVKIPEYTKYPCCENSWPVPVEEESDS